MEDKGRGNNNLFMDSSNIQFQPFQDTLLETTGYTQMGLKQIKENI